jgi:hypothetical protein
MTLGPGHEKGGAGAGDASTTMIKLRAKDTRVTSEVVT